jgi:hypothetical protein
LLIPIGTLGIWSIFNIFDFGKPHLVGRPMSPRSLQLYWNLSVYWIGVLGAITPFAGMVFYSKIQLTIHTWVKSFWWLLLLMCLGSYSLLLIWFVLEPQRLALNLVLMTAFLSTGIGLLIAALHTLWKKVIQ